MSSELDSAPGAEWPGLLEAELLRYPCPGLTCIKPTVFHSRCTDCHAAGHRSSANSAILFPLQAFDANDLYQGQNFNKVLSSLVTLNKVTAGMGCLSAEPEGGEATGRAAPSCQQAGA